MEKTLLSLISIATGSQKQKKYDDQLIKSNANEFRIKSNANEFDFIPNYSKIIDRCAQAIIEIKITRNYKLMIHVYNSLHLPIIRIIAKVICV